MRSHAGEAANAEPAEGIGRAGEMAAVAQELHVRQLDRLRGGGVVARTRAVDDDTEDGGDGAGAGAVALDQHAIAGSGAVEREDEVAGGVGAAGVAFALGALDADHSVDRYVAAPWPCGPRRRRRAGAPANRAAPARSTSSRTASSACAASAGEAIEPLVVVALHATLSCGLPLVRVRGVAERRVLEDGPSAATDDEGDGAGAEREIGHVARITGRGVGGHHQDRGGLAGRRLPQRLHEGEHAGVAAGAEVGHPRRRRSTRRSRPPPRRPTSRRTGSSCWRTRWHRAPSRRGRLAGERRGRRAPPS